jgi:hypothetical protein
MTAILDHGMVLLTVGFWLIVAAGATIAVFSPNINDTLLERIGLGAVAVCAVGTACRYYYVDWVSEGGFAMSAAMAFYVVAIVIKHRKTDRRGDDRRKKV